MNELISIHATTDTVVQVFSPSFRNETLRAELSGGNSSTPLLLYAGRLAKEKRLERLKAVVDAYPEARLVLVGNGPARQELEQTFNNTSTIFLGAKSGEE